LNIVTTLTAQVDQQKAVVVIQDGVVEASNDKVDVAYATRDVACTTRDAAQTVLDQSERAIDTASEERDEMQAALQDEELFLVMLQGDLDFHTQRLRNTEPL